MPGGRSRSETSRPRPCPRARSRSRSSPCRRRIPRGCTPCSADSASAAWRWRSRSSSLSIRKTPRWPPESAGLRTAGRPTVRTPGGSRRATGQRRTAVAGPLFGERAPHHDLVPHPLRDAVPIDGSPRRSVTSATTGTARSAETVSAPSTAWRRATSVTASTSVKSTASRVGDLQPERLGVAVDCDDAEALLPRLHDRAPLVAPGADEEDGLHAGDASPDRPLASGPRRLREAGRRRCSSVRSRSRRPGSSFAHTGRPSRRRSRAQSAGRRRSRARRVCGRGRAKALSPIAISLRHAVVGVRDAAVRGRRAVQLQPLRRCERFVRAVGDAEGRSRRRAPRRGGRQRLRGRDEEDEPVHGAISG